MSRPRGSSVGVLGQVNTLRFRIAALCLLVSGIVLVVLCATILHVRNRQLREDFDERLISRAEVMAEAISLKGTRRLTPTTGRRDRSKLNRFHFPDYYFEIRTGDGDLLERSRNLRSGSLPFGEAARAARQTRLPVLETLSGQTVAGLLGEPGSLRLVTIFLDEPEEGAFFLQVASSLAPVEDSMRDLRRLFFGIVPVGLVVAGLASWLMARRSLSPISNFVRQAREVTASRLGRRLEAPSAKDELTEMVTVINEVLDRLEAAFKSQNRFIADVSHELKTPLSVLLGRVQVLLQQPRSTKDYQQFVASVQDELRQLARLVDSLLILSRAESGAPLKPMSVSINDVVMDAMKACEPLAEERQVRLIPHLALPAADGPEPVVSGDPMLLRSMMENLFRNAIRYSPMQGAVEVHAEVDGGEICLAVHDNGPGIPAKHLAHVFDRFYRIHHDGGGPQGAGLGLAIAKEVTKLHKGTIEATNPPEGGCVLSVRLPLEWVDGGSA